MTQCIRSSCIQNMGVFFTVWVNLCSV